MTAIEIDVETITDRGVLEAMYRNLWAICCYIGYKLGKRPKCCPNCGRDCF